MHVECKTIYQRYLNLIPSVLAIIFCSADFSYNLIFHSTFKFHSFFGRNMKYHQIIRESTRTCVHEQLNYFTSNDDVY
jgi:hypothetical protein